mmetsp:Transcript_29721/g.81387  ORF Transcript_29721/g.81387 Transcript_29721/m.81387 type:complete len:259 (+) Transcript_29721:179-955(+)
MRFRPYNQSTRSRRGCSWFHGDNWPGLESIRGNAMPCERGAALSPLVGFTGGLMSSSYCALAYLAIEFARRWGSHLFLRDGVSCCSGAGDLAFSVRRSRAFRDDRRCGAGTLLSRGRPPPWLGCCAFDAGQRLGAWAATPGTRNGGKEAFCTQASRLSPPPSNSAAGLRRTEAGLSPSWARLRLSETLLRRAETSPSPHSVAHTLSCCFSLEARFRACGAAVIASTSSYCGRGKKADKSTTFLGTLIVERRSDRLELF